MKTLTFQGAPCRVCHGTERYAVSKKCIPCQKRHALKTIRNRQVIIDYAIPVEFTRWVTAPQIIETSDV